MKKANHFVLGICLATLGLPNSAFARSMTGFAAFHVEVQYPYNLSSDPYTCLGENFGAVVNNCGTEVSLVFGLPIDTTGDKTITVQNFWSGTRESATFACQLYAYGGENNYIYPGQVSFTRPSQTKSFSFTMPNGGWSMQLVCFNVPAGGGIANINWTP
jgi:hypothetical protein